MRGERINGMKPVTYEDKKAKYRQQVESFLRDYPPNITLTVNDVKRYLHGSSAAALTMPILKDLMAEGKIEVLMQGNDGVIYVTREEKDASQRID